jgi:DNA-binding winged helix-turn-helix (wHTH) protein
MNWQVEIVIRKGHRVCAFTLMGVVVDLGLDNRRNTEGRHAEVARAGLGGATESSSKKVPARCVLFGDFELDVQEQRLTRAGQNVKIPGKIYQAMLVLVESPGDLVTRDQIRSRLWPRDALLNYDANVNTTVNKLRQVLGDSSEGSNFIQTVPRRGYSFVAPVRYANAPAVKPNDERGDASNARGFAAIGEALRSERARIWFTASVVTWLTVAVLFAGAMLWHAHKVNASVKRSAQVQVIDKQAIDKR